LTIETSAAGIISKRLTYQQLTKPDFQDKAAHVMR
jgi:hypothetical protein